MKTRQLDDKHGAAEEALYEAFALCKTKEEAKQFLMDLCTPSERQALSDRWQVVAPLMQEIPYRTIHDMTGVSVTTIGRVARNIAEGPGGYRVIYERTRTKS